MLAKATAALAMATLAFVAAAPGSVGSPPAPAGAQTMNHAAVVIDTGDGQVRKFCLAFPEAELDGIEVLRRVDTRPYRFEAFGSKGAGVCMLCGVGCPSGDCFCDPSRYWAYHRAGPGGEPYQASRVGASSTRVRDGDVEGWKWGKGEAPPAATVSEVCGVPEPPRRTAAPTTTSTTTEPPPATTSAPPAAETPPATVAPEGSPPAAPPTTTAPKPGTPVAPPAGAATAAAPVGEPATTTAPAVEEPPSTGEEHGVDGDQAAARTAARTDPQGTNQPTALGLAAFGAVLGGLLVWRARLRRAKVRPVTPVR